MVVAVYFTNWSIYAREYLPDQVPFDSVTHVLYAFLKPTESGTIELSDPWADVEKPMPRGGLGCIGELQLLRRQYPHVRLLASIGGWTHSPVLARAAATAEGRAEIVRSTAQLVSSLGLDGVDLDWEYPTAPAEVSNFIELVCALRNALPANAELTLAVSCGADKMGAVPYAEIDRYVSFYNLMAYDFAGPWSPSAGHHAALYPHGHAAVTHYARVIDPRKLVLGIPLYGRSFARARGLGSTFDGGLDAPYERGVHDVKTLPLAESVETVDRSAVGAVCAGEFGLVSYDNRETAEMKADYVRQQGLGGVMFWEASGDAGIIEAVARRLA